MEKRYKICWSCIAFFALILIIIWGATSCRRTNFEKLKDIPTIKHENYTKYKIYHRQDFGKRFGYQIGHNSIKIDVPTDVSIMMFDLSFREVDYFFFRKFNNWFKDIQFENGIMPINQKENLDCDNFAMLYKSFMSVANYKSGVELEPAVALIVVEQRHSFGGIPGGYGALHMVNLVFTSKAWYIFEPQTGEYIELEKYPNQKYIKIIII